jgi:hypothetical protein
MASTTWQDGLQWLLRRVEATGERVTDGFPHYGDPATGRSVTSPGGDWTGSFWNGLYWLGRPPHRRGPLPTLGPTCSHAPQVGVMWGSAPLRAPEVGVRAARTAL